MRRLLLAGLLTLAGCTPSQPEVEPRAEDEARSLSARTRWVKVRKPVDASLLEAPAVVRAEPSASGDVASTFRSRVARVHVRVGSTVEAGDPVVDVIAPEVIEAAAVYGTASQRLAVHRERAAELRQLREEGLVDTAKVFEQRAIVAELEAERDRAIATLLGAGVEPSQAPSLVRRGLLTLRAPVSGVVVALDAKPGEIRDASDRPFARIRGSGPIRVEVRSSQPWPPGAWLALHVPGEAPLPLSPEPLVSTLDPETGTRIHWFAPKDAPSLPDGLRGSVRLSAGEDVWEVPVAALVHDGQGAHVLRRRGVDAQQIPVDVMAASGASALVKGPFILGDLVAVGAAP